jgi:hypothetical protein
VRPSDIVDISLQVVREHRSVAARALEEIHFRSAQVIDPALVAPGLARCSRR